MILGEALLLVLSLHHCKQVVLGDKYAVLGEGQAAFSLPAHPA